jgi:hypothetical protein
VRHRCRDPAGELLDKRETGYNAGVLSGNLRAHLMSSGAPLGNRGTKRQSLMRPSSVKAESEMRKLRVFRGLGVLYTFPRLLAKERRIARNVKRLAILALSIAKSMTVRITIFSSRLVVEQ